jgi:hypothetical protein
MWDSPQELATLVCRWLPDHSGRRLYAAKAHARAVPAYSIPQRAVSVLQYIETFIKEKNGLKNGLFKNKSI